MGTMKIGWSEISITPDKKISLDGQFAERISEYVEKPLTATAFAVEAGGEQMVLVSCDLAAIFWGLVEDVRAALADNTVGLDPKKVVISAIHTHTGPVYNSTSKRTNVPGQRTARQTLESFLAPGQKYVQKVNASEDPDVATPAEVAELLRRQLPKVILEAWNNRKEGSFSNAFGRAAVGMCRRAAYTDDTAQMWGDTNTAVFEALEGGNDSGIELLFVYDSEKKLTGIVANIACPAQCVQHRLFVSPDYWGEVKVRLREYFGQDLFLLALCSAAGDQCPVDLVRWVEPESDLHDPNCKRNNPPKRKADPSMFDLAGMYKAGKRIAREIIDVWEEGLDAPQEDPVFIHKVEDMPLPIRRTTLTEINNAKKAIKDYLREQNGRDVDYNDVANNQVHLGILNRAVFQEHVDVLQTEVHTIRLGTIAIASNPFELFLDYGNRMKARSKAMQTFVVQLCCGTSGYLPTEKAEKAGHYSAYVSSGNVGHEGGDLLTRNTIHEINEMFD